MWLGFLYGAETQYKFYYKEAALTVEFVRS